MLNNNERQEDLEIVLINRVEDFAAKHGAKAHFYNINGIDDYLIDFHLTYRDGNHTIATRNCIITKTCIDPIQALQNIFQLILLNNPKLKEIVYNRIVLSNHDIAKLLLGEEICVTDTYGNVVVLTSRKGE